jgi:hypothetical protein
MFDGLEDVQDVEPAPASCGFLRTACLLPNVEQEVGRRMRSIEFTRVGGRHMPRAFKGVIDLDIRQSKPDWDAFLDAKAPKDAPNVLVILYDDTGQAAWSPYGGRINMPTMDRLAKDGLTYSQWHTTAVCSPTRSCFLTGRNHHHNGFGSIS